MSEFFLKLPIKFPVDMLALSLKRQPQLFGRNPARRDSYGSPHAQMTDIWVRYNGAKVGPTFNDEHFPVWYPEYFSLPELRPIIFDLMAHVEGEHLGGVLITKIPPGGGINPHIDTGWHAEFYDKFYIPIENEEGANFCFPDGEISPEPGECYWFDNSVSHWVENNSKADRIALIICIRKHRAAL